jgi:hypothetical protein
VGAHRHRHRALSPRGRAGALGARRGAIDACAEPIEAEGVGRLAAQGPMLALAAACVAPGCGRTELEPAPLEASGARNVNVAGRASGASGTTHETGGRDGFGGRLGFGGGPGRGGRDGGPNGGASSGGAPLGGVGGFAGGMLQKKGVPELCEPALIPDFDGTPGTPGETLVDSGVAFDFNHDGKVDLATGDRGGDITVYFGNGDGSLAGGVTYGSGLNPSHVPDAFLPGRLTAADLNHDGNMDLVSSSSGTPRFSILLGQSDGTFSAPTSYDTGANALPQVVAVSDLDGDGANDLVIATLDSAFTSRVSLFPGRGDGTLGDHKELWTGSNVRSITLGDLNGDDRNDLVVVSDGSVTVLLGDGSGGLDAGGDFALDGIQPTSVDISDVNADGLPDLVVGMVCDPSAAPPTALNILIGIGDGTFEPAASYQAVVCGGGGRVTSGDLNRDGAQDVAISPDGAFLGRGDGKFAPEITSSQSVGGSLLALGDFDADGFLDAAIYAPGLGTAKWVLVRHGNGDGTFGPIRDFATPAWPSRVALDDVNLDGSLDAVALEPTIQAVSVLLGTGEGAFTDASNYSTRVSSRTLALGKLDADDQPDLVTANDGGDLSVLLGSGDGHFESATLYALPSGPVAAVVGDVNGDRRADIVTANEGINVSVLLGDRSGVFSTGPTRALDDLPTAALLEDVNGDGRLDVVAASQSASRLSVLLGDGDGSFGPPRHYLTGDRPEQIVAGDLDGDGKPDLITLNAGSLSVFLSSAGGSFPNRIDYATDGSALALALADIDLDGRLDVLLSESGLNVWFGNGDGTFRCAGEYAPGTNATGLAVGDLNHDGRPDVVTTGYAGVSVFLNRAR